MRHLFLLILFSSVFCKAQNPEDGYTRLWGTYFPANIQEIVVDGDDNLWVAGHIEDDHPSFDTFDGWITADAHQSNYGGGDRDVFLAKFSPQGNLLYATYFGGSADDELTSIDVTDSKLYITGRTLSTQNIATNGTHEDNLVSTPQGEISKNSYIAEFDLNTGQQNWGTYYQGDRGTYLQFLRAFADDIFVFGTSNSSNMGTNGAFKESIPPPYENDLGEEVFPDYPILAKFDTTGNLDWATYYGPDITSPESDDQVYVSFSGLAVDNTGNVYVGGSSSDQEGFYGSSGAHQPNVAGNNMDCFIAKFSPTGQRDWGTYYGGTGGEALPKIFSPRGKFIYVTGVSLSDSGISTPNAWQESLPDQLTSGRFLSKFDLQGNLEWGTYLNADINSIVFVEADASDNVFSYSNSAGLYNSSEIDGNYQDEVRGNNDNLLLQISPNGSTLDWGTYYGGDGVESVNLTNGQISMSDAGIYLSGTTQGGDNMITENAFYDNLVGQGSSFIARFVACPEPEAPIAEAYQAFEANSDASLEDLEVEFTPWSGSELIITWYSDSDGENEILSDTLLEDEATYYVSRKIQGCTESELTEINVAYLSTEDNTLNSIQISPNPSQGKFLLSGLPNSELTYKIYNLQGKQLLSGDISTSGDTHEFELPTSLNSGMYILQLKTNKQVQSLKLMLE
ncbi:MAG: T9SS type A sorting domain-containing protein [Psychroflexus sp.]